MAKDSYDRVLEKLNKIEDRLAEFEATITIALIKLEKSVEVKQFDEMINPNDQWR
jgi:hypothetical protein